MSRRADGVWRCDNCGAELPNDGVHSAAVVADLNPVRVGEARKAHLCRANGCAALLEPLIPLWPSSPEGQL